jgi:hypothetical protein
VVHNSDADSKPFEFRGRAVLDGADRGAQLAPRSSDCQDVPMPRPSRSSCPTSDAAALSAVTFVVDHSGGTSRQHWVRRSTRVWALSRILSCHYRTILYYSKRKYDTSCCLQNLNPQISNLNLQNALSSMVVRRDFSRQSLTLKPANALTRCSFSMRRRAVPVAKKKNASFARTRARVAAEGTVCL